MRRGLLALLVLLAAVLPTQAQTGLAGRTLTIGPTPAPADGTTVRLDGLGTSGGTNVLFTDSDGDVFARLLGKSDLPASVGYTDEAETWSLLQTFSSGAALADGSAGTPALRWTSDTNTGLFRPGNDILGFSAGGTERARLSASGLSLAVPITTSSGSLTVGSASGTVEWATATDYVNPGTAGRTQLGTIVAPYLSLDVMELHTSMLVADERIAFTNAFGTWGRGTQLSRALTSGATTIYTRHNALRYGDYVMLRSVTAAGIPQYEILQVTEVTGVLQAEGDYAYTVTRDEDGTGANAWAMGDAVVSTDRMVDVFAYSAPRTTYWGSVLGDRPRVAFSFAQSPAVDLAGSGGTATLASGAAATSGGGGFTSTPGHFIRSASSGALYSGITTSLAGAQCAISVEVVIRTPTSAVGTGTQDIAIKGESSGTRQIQLRYYGSDQGQAGEVIFSAADPVGGLLQRAPSTGVLSLAAWHHVVVTYDTANGGATYVDGALVGTMAGNGQCLSTNSDGLRGGGFFTSTTGQAISELAVYDYPLSATQVAAHYEATRIGESGLRHGPSVMGSERTAWDDPFAIATRWALGQLQGISDYDTPTMGFWAGDEAATWVSADASNGFRIGYQDTVKLHGKTNGDLDLGGNLNLVTGGDIKSSGNFSLTGSNGLVFEPSSSSSGDAARSVRWSNGAAIFSETTLLSAELFRSGAAAIELRARNESLGVTGFIRMNAPTSGGDPVSVIIGAGSAAEVQLLPGTTGTRTIGDALSNRIWSAVYATTYHAGATAGYTGTCTGNPVVSGGIVTGCS